MYIRALCEDKGWELHVTQTPSIHVDLVSFSDYIVKLI